MGYCSATKKNEIMPFAATWRQLEIITLKVKKERERQIPYNITYTWTVKYVTNENRNRLKDMGNRLVVVKRVIGWRGQKGGRGMDWAFGLTSCKLLHLEWINNQVLLYITRNYIQPPVINCNGKEYKYGCNFCIAQYCNQLYFNLKKQNKKAKHGNIPLYCYYWLV